MLVFMFKIAFIRNSEFAIWMSIKMAPERYDKNTDLESCFKIFDENGGK